MAKHSEEALVYKNADHILARGWGEQAGGTCTHCGEVLRFQLPVSSDTFCALIRAFVRRHRDCPPPVGTEPSNV